MRKLALRHFTTLAEDRMNVHKNARPTPLGRERIVVQVLSWRTPEVAAFSRRLPADPVRLACSV